MPESSEVRSFKFEVGPCSISAGELLYQINYFQGTPYGVRSTDNEIDPHSATITSSGARDRDGGNGIPRYGQHSTSSSGGLFFHVIRGG